MKPALPAIYFHYLVRPFPFSERNRVKQFIYQQLKKEGKEIDTINYIFCDDAYLLQINRHYLNHDTLTDIITFELSPKTQPLLSDVYISVERVRENARLYNSSFNKELHRVLFHGALHLAGFKDKNKEDKALMREMENNWLQKYFVPRNTVS